jgi:hypothetical protein
MPKFLRNKKYKLKQDFVDTIYGKIPQGMVVTFICITTGIAKFKMPNGKHIGVPEKTALSVMEYLN